MKEQTICSICFCPGLREFKICSRLQFIVTTFGMIIIWTTVQLVIPRNNIENLCFLSLDFQWVMAEKETLYPAVPMVNIILLSLELCLKFNCHLTSQLLYHYFLKSQIQIYVLVCIHIMSKLNKNCQTEAN